jgi:DNA-directed RNA polymerase specialized sigma24 family protein
MRQARLFGALDAEEAVALIARARRSALLGIHRRYLGRQDLEDCYSQATLEMLTRARGRGGFASRAHIANSLELRFVSRIHDRRRALNGRSPIEAELARAIPLSTSTEAETNLHDPRADIERKILARHELRRIAEISHKLSPDQRLLLASRLSDTDRDDFCQRYGWSVEKYRKVSQRAGARLRELVDEDSRSVSTEPRSHGGVASGKRSSKEKLPSSVPFFSSGRNRQQGPTYDFLSPPT